MEGFCRGCLIRYDDPMELLHYNEKYRRLFVYSTGIQIKRNDTITFQLCKDCFLTMKAACKFKKQCRASDKKFKSYLALKDVGEELDFCTFLKNNDDTAFRLPLMSGHSTPAHANKSKDDDNDSTCTSIRNFITDILQGEEMPDTEARIIREVIEEEADVLEDSLDSHWLQDDVTIDSDFKLDFSMSPFRTPHFTNNDVPYTPKQLEGQKEEQYKLKKYFTSISPARHHAQDFTDVIKNNVHEKEICIKRDETDNKNTDIDNADMPIFGKSIDEFDLPANNKYLNNLDISTSANENAKSIFKSSNREEVKSINSLYLPLIDNDKSFNSCDLPSFDSEKSISNLDLPSLPSIPSVVNEKPTNDLEIQNNANEQNIPNFYVPSDGTEYITASKEIEGLVEGEVLKKKDKSCSIENKLSKVLQDKNKKECYLDSLLVPSPQVGACKSGASTPTITSILFGEKILNGSPKRETEDIDLMGVLNEFLTTEKDTNMNSCKDIEAVQNEIEDEEYIDEVDYRITDSLAKSEFELEKGLFDLENFTCKLCEKEKKFDSQRALSIHANKMHQIKIVRSKAERKAYNRPRLCTICGHTYKDNQSYTRHMKSHKLEDKVFQCDKCNIECTSESKLKKHMATHNGITEFKVPGKYVCTICGATSTTPGNFKLHQRRHTNSYLYNCGVCQKGFYRQCELTIHMRIHTGEKPFACRECGKKYARKDVLNIHMRIHLDEYLYQCDHCNMKFSSKNYLRYHLVRTRCMENTRLKPDKTTNTKKEANKEKPKQKRTRNTANQSRSKAKKLRKGANELQTGIEAVEMNTEEVQAVVREVQNVQNVVPLETNEFVGQTVMYRLPYIDTEMSN